MSQFARLRLGDWGIPNTWIYAECLDSGRRWLLDRLSCATLVVFSGGRSTIEALDILEGISKKPRNSLERVIVRLTKQRLLTSTDEPSDHIATSWIERGWIAAYDFQVATDDYPFLDYRRGGKDEDRKRMRAYRSSETDPLTQIAQAVSDREPLRTETLKQLASHFATPLEIEGAPSALNLTKLRRVVSLALAFRMPGNKLRRTSPSGGARHPIDAYVQAMHIKGIPKGLYSYDPAADSLRIAAIDLIPEGALSGFYPPYSAFRPEAIVLLYARFERNMFRYREPRTLRSVFMDAGHVASTIEELSTTTGISCHVHHAVDEDAIDMALGVKLLDCGFIIGVGLSGTLRQDVR